MAITQCKAVHNLKFGSQSMAALKRVGDQLDNAQIGSLLLMSTTFIVFLLELLHHGR